MGPGCTAGLDETQSQDDGVDPQIVATRNFSNNHRGVMPKIDPNASFKTAASAKLVYFGGPVIASIHVVPIMWGNKVNSETQSKIQGFYQAVTNSSYWTWLTEYNTAGVTPSGGGSGTNQVIGAGSTETPITITPSITSTTITDAQIQSEITKQIAAGHLPAPTKDAGGNGNTYYPVYFALGTTITQGGGASCSVFCAYHGTIAGSPDIYYGVLPSLEAGSGCETGCGSAPTTFQNLTSVSSHELVEATTDAAVGLATVAGPPLAWYDNTNGEIGDICNASQGTAAGYTVQKEWSNKQGACVVSGGTCSPSCSGKNCGPDGCGGTCGTMGGNCPSGQTCNSGVCGTTCVPKCSGKVCGPDGCGGSCGTCPSGQSCNSSGQCTTTCVPSCTGKSCGSDGCGGSCGTCPSGQTCSGTGQCTGGGTCAHDKCTTGSKLKKACDPCVSKICGADPFCCYANWDKYCVQEVGSICGASCP